MAKSDKHIVLERVAKTAELLLKASSREVIVQYASKNWKVTDRQADTYIKRAREIIEGSVKRKVEFDYAMALRRYEDLYSKAMSKKDYRLATNVNKEIATLQGLYKTQIEQSSTFSFINNIPD